MAFPSTPLDIRVQVALDEPDLSNPSGWSWTDATSYVMLESGITTTIGRADQYAQMPPSTLALTLDNTDGRWTRTNPTGAWYGRIGRNTPIRVQVNNGSGYKTRFTGTIDELPPRWDLTGRYAVAPTTASGPLRRADKRGTTKSALFRTSAAGYFSPAGGTVVAYWPCEDASGATSIASGVGGAPAVIVGAVTLAADSDMAGSDPLPKLSATGAIVGTIPSYSADNWTGRFAIRIPAEPAGTTVLAAWNCITPTPFTHFRLVLTPGTPAVLQLQALNAAGTDILGAGPIQFYDVNTNTEPFGEQLYVEVNVRQNGANIDYDVYCYGLETGYTGTYASATVSTIAQMYTVAQAGMADVTIGHLRFSTGEPFTGLGGVGAFGYPGEDAGVRWVRTADELGLPWNWSSHTSTLMGAQPTDTVIGQIREIGDAEGVPMYDAPTGHIFLPARVDRYNQSVALSLSFTGAQIQPPQPTDDDQYIRNDITVTRRGGSSVRRVQTTGPNNLSVGIYEDSVTLNVEKDRDLPARAEWLRHLGTVDELRYPQLGFHLASRGMVSKIDNWLNCTIGSRVQVASPSLPGLAPDTVDVLIEGWTEYIKYPREWDVVLNCSPAAPWTVFQLEDSTLGRLDTVGSALLDGVTSAATTMRIATTGAPIPPKTSTVVWSTTSPPYDLDVGGERVTVTAMATNAATFVNAGTASHGDNATLAPALPASVTGGDLLLVLAAIRNTAATITTPTGYEVLWSDGNIALFGKIHSGSESAPSVAFSGGSLGDTTSAQMAAFRNTQSLVHASANTSNAAAANITTPACTIIRDRCVVLTLGWKQDDWTSVATLAGMTEIGEPSTITGNDQGIVWDYVIQTTAANISASSFVVTGGTNQIGKAAVVALCGDVQTATVTRSVNGVVKAQTADTDVALWRPGVGGLAL